MGYGRNFGNNSLFGPGVVGGPKGTGAQLTRILVQFATQYDRGNLEQLSGDLQKLQQQQVQSQQQLSQVIKQQTVEQDAAVRASKEKVQLNQAQQIQLKDLLDAQKAVTDEITQYGRAGKDATANLLAQEKSFKEQSGLVRGVALDLINQSGTERELNLLIEQRAAIEQRIADLKGQQTVEAKAQAAASGSGGIGKGLAGLAIGAIGGTVVGTILGAVAFQPVQEALASLQKHIGDLIDPMEGAKEAANELGKAVNQIASSENLSQLDAANKLVKDIAQTTSTSPRLGFSGDDSKAVAAAEAERLGLDQELVPVLKNELDILKAQGQASADVRDTTRDILTAKSGQPNPFDPAVEATYVLTGNFGQLLQQQSNLNAQANTYTTQLEDQQRLIDEQVAGLAAAQALTEKFGGQALDEGLAHYTSGITQATKTTTDELQRASDVHIRTLQQEEQATITGIQRTSDARVRALEQESQRLDNGDTRSQRTKNLQAAIAALSTQGPTQAVKGLTDALDALQKKQAEILAQRKATADAEKIDLLQLQARLEKQGEIVDVEQYAGKERIVAINADIALLQKRTQLQSTMNALLTAEANIAKGINRNTGESIQDFLNRRAEFYRTQLADVAKAQADQQTQKLTSEKDQLQTLSDLHDAEVKQQQDREDAMYAAREKRLQKELAAQQKADQIALTKHRQELEAELQASQKADANALEAKRQAIQDEIAAVRQKYQNEITDQRNNYADAIKIFQNETKAQIDEANKQRDAKIQAEHDYVTSLKDQLNKSNTDEQVAALHQANTLAAIMQFAGGVAGAGYSAALLRAQGQTLGLSDFEINALIANADKVHLAYQQALDRYQVRLTNPSGDVYAGPHAKGFVFPLGNQHDSSPFGMNIRHGEENEEMGVILSNKVTQALKDTSKSQPLIGGDMVIHSGEDPYRARSRWRREVEDIVDRRLSGVH